MAANKIFSNLFRLRRRPMIFVLVTSSWAALIKLKEFYDAGNWLLVTIDVVVVITTFLVILEAVSVISKIRRERSRVPGKSQY